MISAMERETLARRTYEANKDGNCASDEESVKEYLKTSFTDLTEEEIADIAEYSMDIINGLLPAPGHNPEEMSEMNRR